MGFYGLRDGKVAVFTVHRTSDPTMPRDAQSAVREAYATLGWVVPRALAKCPESSDVYYDQVAQIEIPRWSRGRVTLLGDACHPTLPFLGQGGVMSIEAGYVVAACLDKYFGDPGVAFTRYEEIRKDRTSMVVRKASENKASAFEPRLADKDLVAVRASQDPTSGRVLERLRLHRRESERVG